jgi:hypothetical protein
MPHCCLDRQQHLRTANAGWKSCTSPNHWLLQLRAWRCRVFIRCAGTEFCLQYLALFGCLYDSLDLGWICCGTECS